jgi:enoyl-CoA hydratase/carnithine racemase
VPRDERSNLPDETTIGLADQEVSTEVDGLKIELTGQVLRLTVTRPDARNAHTPSLWRRFREARDLALAKNAQVVVLAGEGTSFSAGLDTRMFTPEGVPGEGSLLQVAMGDDDEVHAMIGEIQDSFSWFSEIPAITIAAVQGHAVGAGFQMALACDFIVCADDAKFSMREAKYGLVPDLTGTSPLVRTVGYKRALEICLTTRWVLADEAVRLGIAVDSVPVSSLAERTQELVDVVTSGIPGTAAELKSLLSNAVVASPVDQRVAERNAQIQRFKWLKKTMGV